MKNVTNTYDKDDLTINGVTVIDENCILDRGYSPYFIGAVNKIKKKFHKLIKNFDLADLTKALPDNKLHELHSSGIISGDDYVALLNSCKICDLLKEINNFEESLKTSGIIVPIRDKYIDKYIFLAKIRDEKYFIPIEISSFENPLTLGECDDCDMGGSYVIYPDERQLIDKCVKLNIIDEYWSDKIYDIISSEDDEYINDEWDIYTKERLNSTDFPNVIDGKTII